MRKAFLYIAIVAAVLAFGVVMLGAYVRLSQAGLGCPDWPGCYGHVTVPRSTAREHHPATGVALITSVGLSYSVPSSPLKECGQCNV